MDFGTLAAVVLGGLISLATSIAYHAWDRRQRRLSLQRMLKAEIVSLFSGAEKRRHEEKIREEVEKFRSGNIHEPFYRIFGLDNVRTSEIYDRNMEHIGLLEKHIAEKVVIFYKTLNGIINDIVEIGNSGGGTPGNIADTLEEDLESWAELKTLGSELIDEL